VKNVTAALVKLRIPARAAGSGRVARPVVFGEAAWKLQITVVVGKFQDTENYIGLHRTALSAWDPDDYPEPPSAPGGGLSLSFPHLDWDLYPDRYTSDLRPPGETSTVWEIVVETTQAGPAQLTVIGLEQVPLEVSLVLLDLATGILIDLREHSSYAFTINDPPLTRQFRLVAGQRGGVEEVVTDYHRTPTGFVLLPNVPNPFNQATTMAYQVPRTSRVRLAIYDLSGQEIVVLRDEVSDPGYLTIEWAGQDARGVEVSSGVYVVVLEAEGRRFMRKLLLLR
jgi:hypothetical protein